MKRRKFRFICKSKCSLVNELAKRTKAANVRVQNILDKTWNNSRGFAEQMFGFSLLHEKFDKALICYGFGLNSFCLIEIYSILETSLIRRLRLEFKQISLSPKLNKFLRKKGHLFEIEYFLRQFKATEIAEILKKLDILDETDVNFLKELQRLRGAMAHKNLIRIEHHLEKMSIIPHRVHIHNIDERLGKVNIEDYFLRAIRFEWKLLPINKKYRFKKNINKFYRDAARERDIMNARK